MKAVIDSIKGEYIRCLLENGDTMVFHSSELDGEAKLGDFVEIKINLNKSNKN